VNCCIFFYFSKYAGWNQKQYKDITLRTLIRNKFFLEHNCTKVTINIELREENFAA